VPDSRLTELQRRVLSALAGMEPAWTLTGGGAVVGFHAPYRATRDLDLFWRGRSTIEAIARDAEERLIARGFRVQSVRRSESFARLSVQEASSEEACVLDLVAESHAAINPPLSRSVEGFGIRVDSAPELAVNKLVALLSRYELRDLADLRELLACGADLQVALGQAPAKDGGFSPATLAWVLRSYPFERYRKEELLPPEAVEGLEAFRAQLIETLVSMSDPGDRVHERP